MAWDNAWEKVFSTREWGKYPPEELVRFVARNYYHVPERSSVHILDLGCGTGASAWFIAREGFTTYGIDGSPTGIKIARKRFASEGLHADLQVGDIVQIDYRDAQFDAVTDVASIQHNTLPNIRKIVKEVHRVLKPDGKFFGMMIAEDIHWAEWAGRTHFFRRNELKKLFKDFNSFTIEEVLRKKDNGKSRLRFFIVQATK